MVRMTGAKAFVEALKRQKVDVIFGIPGGAVIPIYDVLYDTDEIKHVLMRHEQCAAHAADGYARVTGKVGVCSVTSGPAATNLVTGLYASQVDSIPIVAITGQNTRAQLGKEAFQAVDIAEIGKPVTKKSYCVKEAEQIPWVFREAFRIAKEGRPGPVLIDLPLDVQKGEVEYDPELDSPLEISRPGPDRKK